MSIPRSPYIAYNQNRALINDLSAANKMVVVAKEKKVTLDTGVSKSVVIFTRVPADCLKGNKFDCEFGSGKNAVKYILNRIQNNPTLTPQEKNNLILPIKTQLLAGPKNKYSTDSPHWKGDLLSASDFEQLYKFTNLENKIQISDFSTKKLAGNFSNADTTVQERPSALPLDNIKNLTSKTTSVPPNRPPPLPHSAEKKEPPKIEPQLPPRAPLPDWLNFKKNE